MLSVPVVIHGTDPAQQPFREESETLVINAHGALLTLAQKVFQRQQMRLENPKTKEAQDCRVTFVGITRGGKMEVGVEFTLPNPKFWRVAFPPEDWSVHHPNAKAPGKPSRQ